MSQAGQWSVMNVSLGDSVDVGDIYRAKTNSRAEITFSQEHPQDRTGDTGAGQPVFR